MPPDSCPYSESVAAQLADPTAHLDTELASHLPLCEACRRAASAAVRRWPTDRSPSPSLAEWLSESVGKATVVSPFQAQKLAVGQAAELKLGQYLLLDRLGAGGMGEVYHARHMILRREDALKTLRPDIARNANAIKRFLHEAEAIAKLQHPNVVRVYNADHAGVGYYIAMEYVPGTDLGHFTRAHGPLPIPLAAELVRQAATGVHHAFTHGLVHRDLKPGNLLLQVSNQKIENGANGPVDLTVLRLETVRLEDFQVKVADFGLARALAPDEQASEMTGAGAVLGTTDYMAPEQAHDARTADTRADVYSLGCTLYHLLTGAVPFPNGTPIEKMIRHATAPVPVPSALRADTPPALDAIVQKCLAKRPEERYQTPGELATALAPFTRAAEPYSTPVALLDLPEPIPPEVEATPRAEPLPISVAPRTDYGAPQKPKRSFPWVWAGAGFLVLALAVIIAVQTLGGPRREEGTKADPSKTAPGEPQTDPKGKPPDSEPEARPEQPPEHVPIPRFKDSAPWRFSGACWSTRTDKVRAVGFLADGSIVAGREGNLPDGSNAGFWEVWPKTGGGKPLRAARPANTLAYEYPAYVQPGRALVTEQFHRFDPVTFEPLPALAPDLTKYGRGSADIINCATTSGDGKFLIGGVTAYENGTPKRFVVEWEADTGKVRTAWQVETIHDLQALTADHTGDTVATGTIDGQIVVLSTSKDGARIWDVPNTTTGVPDPVSAIAISANGKTIYTSHAVGGRVHVWNPDTRQRVSTLPLEWSARRLVVSPDGRWLVAIGGAVTVWDLKAEPIKAYELAIPWAGEMMSAAFSADSKRLVVGGQGRDEQPTFGEGVVWLWELK